MKRLSILAKSMSLIASGSLFVVGTELPVVHAASPVTITFWCDLGGQSNVVMKSLVAEFNKTHKDIHVNYSFVASTGSSITPQKLLTAMAGGTAPDATDINSFDVAQFAQKGTLLNLTSYDKLYHIDKSQFVPALWQANSWNGNPYALHLTTDVRFLFWNKTMFKAAGLNPNKPPQTIAELDQDAAKLTKYNAKRQIVQAGFVPWGDQGWLPTWNWAFGGNFNGPKGSINTANPHAIQALTWEQSYAKKYGISKLNAFTSAVPTGSTAFIAGKEAMTVDGCWDVTTIKQKAPKLNYGIEPVPTLKKSGMTWSAGYSLAVPSGSKHPQEAFEFISWLDAPKQMEQYAVATGTYPAQLALLKQVGKPGHVVVSPEADKLAAQMLPKTYTLPASPAAPQWWDSLAQGVSKVTNDVTTSAASVLKTIDQQINQQIQMES